MNKRLRRAMVGVLATGTAVTSLMVGTVGTASAAAGESFLYRGQTLHAGQMIHRYTPKGWEIQLVMQTDGNLVEYLAGFSGGGRYVCWASNTNTGSDYHATYQQDGNFVVYAPSGKAVWASNTVGGSGQTVDMNDIGVLYVGNKAINGGC
ncbi:hypothetical protein [Streptomyces sp. NPDC001020]